MGEMLEEENYIETYNDNESMAKIFVSSLKKQEKWCSLVEPDSFSPKQLDGTYIFDRSKDFEMVTKAIEEYLLEQQAWVDHYKEQAKNLRKKLKEQTKTYENFETQIEQLRKNYYEISSECMQHKEKNQAMWKSVQSLEEVCEMYSEELEKLKTKNNTCDNCKRKIEEQAPNNEVCKEKEGKNIYEAKLISFKIYSEEANRKLAIERSQRIQLESELHQMKDVCDEIQKELVWLKFCINENKRSEHETEHVHALKRSQSMSTLTSAERRAERYLSAKSKYNEENLNSHSNGIKVFRERAEYTKQNISVSHNGGYQNTDAQRACLRCERKHSKNETGTHRNTCTNYRQLFAEIFEKLKIPRD